jgi:shikimate dehydrogenase
VNTVKIENDKLYGFNTDAQGFVGPLKEQYGDLSGARVAVVGAGGAARACIFALIQEGINVTLFARDASKASAMADEFRVSLGELPFRNGLLNTDILVNATPLGTIGETEHQTIATAEQLSGVELVYDLIYNPKETRLIREAQTAGCKTIGGLDMLIEQAKLQFRIWTGEEADGSEMAGAAKKRLGI